VDPRLSAPPVCSSMGHVPRLRPGVKAWRHGSCSRSPQVVAFASEYKSGANSRCSTLQGVAASQVLRDGQFLTVPLDQVVVGRTVIWRWATRYPAWHGLSRRPNVHDKSADGRRVRAGEQARRPDDPAMGGTAGCLPRHASGRRRRVMVVTEVGDTRPEADRPPPLSAEDERKTRGATAAETEERRVKSKLTISKN